MKNQSNEEIIRQAKSVAKEGAAGPACEKDNADEDDNEIVNKLVDKQRESSLYFRTVKAKTEVYDIISRSFSRQQGWQELPHGLDLRNSWNFMWSWSKITIDLTKLLVF